MTDQVAHQSVEDVGVQRVRLVAHGASQYHAGLWSQGAACGAGAGLVIKKLNYVGIPTQDQARALAFWTGVMGFIITTDRPVGDRRWIELAIPGAQTGILLFTPEGHEDRVGTFFNGSFGCDNVQYEYERLREKGLKFLGPPELKPFPHVYFQDPDGNTFFLSSR